MSRMVEAQKHKILDKHLENTVTRYEFQSKIHLEDPYAKLAAAVILQGLLDDVCGANNYWCRDPVTFHWYTVKQQCMRPEVYDVLASGIGIECSYDQLKEIMADRLSRGERCVPIRATSWMDGDI